ncbi:PREDICTED: 1-aminocyclopropane-1-carboxylate oxidase 5-like [Nelumbo nucifera]|uniref:1-aminocyclopropane-1-carboxylate oxidase 5-like n=1 Tax=Nelumbo nucifera TaxID=4432 RepID=A0A1U8ANQ5_NELNU|nr:PREDICTED: 1-aminocyclopropane-1-carboxylate oxidase 5-like [Nelumbo nucifera]
MGSSSHGRFGGFCSSLSFSRVDVFAAAEVQPAAIDPPVIICITLASLRAVVSVAARSEGDPAGVRRSVGEIMQEFDENFVCKPVNLGLGEENLQNAFGKEDIGACMRVNYYPKCPQPDLTIDLSPHSDPGGLTLLLADDRVPGLQVLRGGNWVTVKPFPNAFIVNIDYQIQVSFSFYSIYVIGHMYVTIHASVLDGC